MGGLCGEGPAGSHSPLRWSHPNSCGQGTKGTEGDAPSPARATADGRTGGDATWSEPRDGLSLDQARGPAGSPRRVRSTNLASRTGGVSAPTLTSVIALPD